MRRLSVLLSVSVVLVLGIMAVGFAPRAHAQETTPVASPAALPPVLQRWVDGVNTGGDAVAALYAEDGIHEDIPSGMVTSGRQEIADLVTGALNQFDDLRWEPVSAGQVGDLAVLEYAFSATDREIGKPFSFRGVIVFELDGDQIHRSADYYDVATILGELGLLDMGEESAAATPVP